ncbi:MAG: class I SAM-dependent methyltransferase [Phycisphaerales bacterium]
MSSRTVQPEVMDDPFLDAAEHAAALAGLARLNRLSRAAANLWPYIRREAERAGRPLRVLDVATGSADVPVALALRARRAHIQLELHACDVSPRALRIAQTRAERAGVPISTFVSDLQASDRLGAFDVVTCSLFLHHLPHDAAVQALHTMADATGRLLLVSDLRRSRTGLILAWTASRCLTRSRVVHTDAVRSVQAAWTMREMRAMAQAAGLDDATVEPTWPQRMLLRWRRP